MITTALNLQQAEELFRQEGIMLDGKNILPVFRAVELFGAAAGEWIRQNMGDQPHQLHSGEDYNARGACTEERPLIYYLLRSGFLKLVSEHNYCILAQRYKGSEASA